MNNKEIIYRKLKESKKYKYLCADTLQRIASWADERYDAKDAVKAAKNKLHQVFGAFLGKGDLKKIEKSLAQIPPKPGRDGLRDIALEIMRFHASTRERIPVLERFYQELFARTGKPKKVLDLACGLNPFSIQWLDLEPGGEYYGIDIDTRLIHLVNVFFQHFDKPYKAACADILVSLPPVIQEYRAEMVLILKTLPSLEQQEKGAAEKLLQSLKALNARWIVVSFPVKSLSGREKEMADYYHEFMSGICARLAPTYFKLEYPDEIFYIVDYLGCME